MTLHVYAQHRNHDDAFIVGDRDSLIKLREAIDRALCSGQPGQAECEACVADREEYSLYVLVQDSEVMNALRYPYTGAYEPDGTANTWLIGGDIFPSELVK